MMPRDRRRPGVSAADVAQLAARLLVEGSAADFAAARRKAAHKLGVTDRRPLPDNRQIQAAVAEYQRLFERDLQPARLGRLRREALNVMRFLERFAPRLVGPVLYGTACANTPVTLHVYTDEFEALLRHFIDHGIAYGVSERLMRFSAKREKLHSVLTFAIADTDFDLVTFTTAEAARAPLSPLDDRPYERADQRTVAALLAENCLYGSSHLRHLNRPPGDP